MAASTVRTKVLPSVGGVQAQEFGRCGLAYSRAHGLVVTGGIAADGDPGLRLTRVTSNGALARMMDVEIGRDLLPGTCTALGVSPDGAFVAAADKASGDVKLYALPALTFERNVCRAALPTRAIAFSQDGLWIAAGGDDGTVRVASRDNPVEGAYDIQVGAFIKAMAFDPLGHFLVITSQDGALAVASLDSADRRVFTRIPGIKTPTARQGDTHHDAEFPVVWHPSGAVVAAATDAGAVVLSRDSWQPVYTARSPGALAHVRDGYTGTCGLSWSPNGRYLACIDGRRLMTVWDMMTPAADALTGAPFARDESGACDPAVALYGFVREVQPEGGDEDSSDAVAAAAGAAAAAPAREVSARPVGMTWSEDGDHVVTLDLDGRLGVTRVRALSKHSAAGVSTAVEEVDAPLSWPMRTAPPRKPTAPSARTAVTDDDVAPEDAAPQSVGAAADASTMPQSSYVDAEAAESDAEVASVADVPTPLPAAPAAAPAGEFNVSISATKRRYGFADVEDDDDTGMGGMRPLDEYQTGNTTAAISVEDIIDKGHLVTVEMLQAHALSTARMIRDVFGFTPAQLPFTPASTPFRKVKHAHQEQRRFLAWNTVGCVIQRRDSPNSVVVVEFADAARHRNVSITDVYGCTSAALAHGGLVLAAPYRPPTITGGGSGTASRIMFRNLSGALEGDEWSFDLPAVDTETPLPAFPSRIPDSEIASSSGAHGAKSGDNARDPGADEDVEDDFIAHEDSDDAAFERDALAAADTSSAAESVQVVAIGEGWVAAATDRQLLRFFRFSGVQDAVIALPGPVVSLAGSGALCAVVYHSSMPSTHTQHMAVDLFTVKCAMDGAGTARGASHPRKVASVRLPLRARALLQWMGFAEHGALMVHDSLGMLYALQPGLDWSWTPVCDTRAAAQQLAIASGMPKAERNSLLWPLAVLSVPASSLSVPDQDTTGAKQGALAIMALPVREGTRRYPPVSTARQVPAYLPLSVPLLGAAATVSAVENAVLRYDLAVKQALWLEQVGILPSTLAAMSSAAAVEATAAALQGEQGSDAPSVLATLRANTASKLRMEAAAVDKTILREISHAATDQQDARLLSFASMLSLEKSFQMAAQLAGKVGRSAVAERLTQLAALRAVESDHEDAVTIAATKELLARAQAALSHSSTSGKGHASILSSAVARGAASRGGLAEVAPVSGSSIGGLAALKRMAAGQENSAPAHGVTSGGPRPAPVYGTDSTEHEVNDAMIAPVNPFGKRGAAFDGAPEPTSPSRKKARDTGGMQGLMMASPDRPAPLNRQASFAVEARARRAERA